METIGNHIDDGRLLCRNSIYQRYSTSDWETSNRNNFLEAEKQRSHAERVRADLFRTVKVTDQMTRTRQQCNTRKLGRLRAAAANVYEKCFVTVETGIIYLLAHFQCSSSV